MTEVDPDLRQQRIESWTALLTRIFGFFLGAGMLSFETLAGQQRWPIVLASLVLMGFAPAAILERALNR
jgi:hypothetical protein